MLGNGIIILKVFCGIALLLRVGRKRFSIHSIHNWELKWQSRFLFLLFFNYSKESFEKFHMFGPFYTDKHRGVDEIFLF
jgi:hypothetical protein